MWARPIAVAAIGVYNAFGDIVRGQTSVAASALAGANCNANYFNVAYQNDNFHEAMGQYANKDYKKTFILAPNYPAGTDALTGFKRYYKGELSGELFTKVGQTDYAAEIAQIRASGADSVFFFLPGGMGINFVKQFVAAGLSVPPCRALRAGCEGCRSITSRSIRQCQAEAGF